MSENYIESCEKEIDSKKDLVFEIKHKKTKQTGFLNIDSKDEWELEGAAIWITSNFCWTTYGIDLKCCPVGEEFMDKDDYVIRRLK